MSDDAIRAGICRLGASLYARGDAHASAGNIGVRLPDGSFLITPTGAAWPRSTRSASHVGADGVQLACCVLHTHATDTVASTLAGV